jgi:hypothetical protein
MMGAPNSAAWARAHAAGRRARFWRRVKRTALTGAAGGALFMTGVDLSHAGAPLPASILACVVAGAVLALAVGLSWGE